MSIREKYIPYATQYIDKEDIDAVVEVLKGDYLTTGPYVSHFEKDFADYVGAKYAVAVNSGTAALHCACIAAGIGRGDEVITSPITFAASSNSVLYCGGKPVFCDINSKTYNIDTNNIEKYINKNTKAIIPVHYTGQPCDMDTINNIAKKHNLIVIEDGAHALGAYYNDEKVGSIGHMTIFSFHPVKHITTGEGGMITTDSKETYDKLIMARSHGITRDKDKLINDEGNWYYEQQFLGYNYRMTDIQASLGSSQLRKIESFLEKRRTIVDMYNEAFRDIQCLTTPYILENAISAWHLYVLKFDLKRLNTTRKEIYDEFRRRNIGVNVHYIPVYYHPYYKELGYKKGLCPNAEDLYDNIITLPLYPKMTMEEVNYVIDSTKQILNSYV